MKNLKISMFLMVPLLFAAQSVVAGLAAVPVESSPGWQYEGHEVSFGPSEVRVVGQQGDLRVVMVDGNAQPESLAEDRVFFPQVWSGIDGEFDRVEGIHRSTWRIAPGADPADIRLSYSAELALSPQGQLVIRQTGGSFIESAPIAWQMQGEVREPVEVAFALIDSQQIGFHLGSYDESRELIIDPTLTWNTTLGDGVTSGTYRQEAHAVATDGAGNVFVAGYAESAWSSGVTVSGHSGSDDVYVAKLNSSGTVLWDTYLGGAADDEGSALVYLDGSLYVVGQTQSESWEEYTPNDSLSTNGDIFVARVNASSGALERLDFLGGTGEDVATGIIATTENSTSYLYLVGSSDRDDWGTTAINGYAGGSAFDIFLAKINTNADLQWYTLMGSRESDSGMELSSDIQSDGSGHVYVFGQSTDTWGSPVRGFVGSGSDITDTVLAKLDSSGNRVAHTFLGGEGQEVAGGYSSIEVSNGKAYVMGSSESTTWGQATGEPVRAHSGEQDIFLASVNTSDLVLDWYTYAGGPGDDTGTSLIVFTDGNLFFSGYTDTDWGGDPVEDIGGGLIDGVLGMVQAQNNATSGKQGGELLSHAFHGTANNDEAFDLVYNPVSDNMFLAGRTGKVEIAIVDGVPAAVSRYDGYVAQFDLASRLSILVAGATQTEDGTYDFGTVDAFSSLTRSVTILNSGVETLTVTEQFSPGIYIFWNNGGGVFDVTAQPVFPAVNVDNDGLLAPGESVDFSLEFDPSENSSYSGKFWLVHNAGSDSQFDLNISGTGSGSPAIDVTGTSDNAVSSGSTTASATNGTHYGTLAVDGSGSTTTFKILNEGSTTLTFDNAPNTVSLSDTTNFTLTQPGASSLAGKASAGATANSTTFTIQFTPKTTGVLEASVSIPSNTDDQEDPYTFVVKGQSTGADINVTSNNVDIEDGHTTPATSDAGYKADPSVFGEVGIADGAVSKTFVIQNLGDGTLNVSSVSITNNTGKFALGSTFTGALTSGSTASITVNFDPDSLVETKETVTIISDDPDDTEATYTFEVSGIGVNPDIAVEGNKTTIAKNDTTPSTLDYTDFGNWPLNESFSRTFAIKANSGANLGVSNIAISGTNASDFTLTDSTASTIAGGDSDTFTISFQPGGSGQRTATVTITNTDPSDGSFSFAIQGWGATVAFSDSELYTTEQGGTATLYVQLSSAPTGTATLGMTFSGAGEVEATTDGSTYSTSSASISFQPGETAPITKSITFRGIDDGIVDLSAVVPVQISLSTADTGYNGIALPSLTVINRNRHYSASCNNNATPGPTFTSGTTICKLDSGTMVLTGVTVQSGATVGFHAPQVQGQPTVTLSSGANVEISSSTSTLDSAQ